MSHLPGWRDDDLHDEHGNHHVPTVRERYDPQLGQSVISGHRLEVAERRYHRHLAAHAQEEQ